MADNINAILLNACGAAYNVGPGETTYTPDTVYHPNVGYQSTPQTACGGERNINAATVGQTPFGIVVAFRGTLPPSTNDPTPVLDWLQNFFAIPASSDSGPNQVPGQVHSGFFNGAASIIHQVQTLIMQMNPGPNNPVFVTGHSKGGAMATIAAYILSQNLGIPNVQDVVTIASPRPGDAAFRDGFQEKLGQTRYENIQDLVPLVPFSTSFIHSALVNQALSFTDAGSRLNHMLESAKDWNYVPVGALKFIDNDCNVLDNEALVDQELALAEEFGSDALNRNFVSFVEAHSLLPVFRYHRGICGVPVV